MRGLDETLKAIAADPKRGVFVSRNGTAPQPELALWMAATLEQHGYIPVLQDAHFKHADFMLAMHETLASGARVLALMSREYSQSQHCMKEATAALDDQRNTSGRLVLLKIDDSGPTGLLRYVAYVDFIKVWRTGDGPEMERVLLQALSAPADLAAEYRIPPAMDALQTLHTAVLMHDEDAFAGRDEDLARLHDLMWNGGTAALTRAGVKGLVDEAALAGMGGVGKTTLARAYAFRHRGEYHGVWWVRAERADTLIDDLIDLGKRDMPDLARWDDRAAAAKHALRMLAEARTNQPWLIVYDNAPGPGVVAPWRPERNAHVLVTSRNPNWDAAMPLDVFTPLAAVDFLCETAGRRQEKDREEAAALAAQLGYLPLALAHAASKCQGNRRIGFAAYGRRLAEFWAERPGERDKHGRYGNSVFGTFTLALDDIVRGGPQGDPPPCPEAETVLGVLAHLAPEQIPEHLLTPLYEDDGAVMSEAAIDRALEELAAAGLVTWGEFEDGAPHLGVHRLVQEIMRARLQAAGRGDEIAALATRAVETTFDGSGSFEAATLNERWLPHARAVLPYAPEEGEAAGHTLWTCLQIGDLNVRRGALGLALDAYRAGNATVQRLSEADPGNAGWQYDLGISNERLGDVLMAQGNLDKALSHYRARNEIITRLAKSDPGNAGWQRDLSVSHNKIGDVLRAQGKLPAALDAFQASLAIRDRIARSDPGNAGWQRDLSVSQENIGDVLRAQGNLPAALDAFQASLAIRHRLAKSDPGNAGWQRDLSVSHTKIGDVLRAQGNLPAALDAFQASLAIADRLAKSDPGNAGWQRDLSVAHNFIGNVQIAQGNLSAALSSYRACNEIIERLAKSDPGNAGWQRDLSVSHDKIGRLLEKEGRLSEALVHFRADLAIAEALAARDPSNATWRNDLEISRARMKRLEEK